MVRKILVFFDFIVIFIGICLMVFALLCFTLLFSGFSFLCTSALIWSSHCSEKNLFQRIRWKQKQNNGLIKRILCFTLFFFCSLFVPFFLFFFEVFTKFRIQFEFSIFGYFSETKTPFESNCFLTENRWMIK